MKRVVLSLAAAALAASGPAFAKPKPKPKPAAAEPAVPAVKPMAADWVQLDPENVLVIDTNKGRIFVELAPDLAPDSVARVKQLTREHFYDGLKFHRVIDDFMAQTGDPLGTGEGGSKYPNVKAEFSIRRGQSEPMVEVDDAHGTEEGFYGFMPIKSQPDELMDMTADHKVASWGRFCPGVAGMARAGDPNSANSQFFLMRQTYPTLEKTYTPFGRVVSGLEVVRALKTGEPVVNPDVMTKVQILADIPEAQRPKVLVLDPKSQAFGAIVAKAKADKGADFSICDVDVPSLVR
jgi:peptidylprolyl isomerase